MLLFILLSPALSYDQMRVQHAQRLMDFHQFWNAYQQLTSVISQETGKIDNKLYRLRAQCCLNMAMTREALEDARKIIKNNPSKDDENYAYTVEARANIQKGNFAEARAAAEKAGDKQLVRNCEQLRSYEVTAKAKIDQGQIGEAGQILDTLIRNAPKAMKIMYERANIAWMAQDLQRFKELANELENEYPNDPNLAYRRGICQYCDGRMDEAMKFVKKAQGMKKAPKSCDQAAEAINMINIHYPKIQKAVDDKMPDVAENEINVSLDAAIPFCPQNSVLISALNNMRIKLVRLRHTPEESIEILSEMLDKDPQNIELMLERGEANLELEDYDAALFDFQNAQRHNSNDKRIQDGINKANEIKKEKTFVDHYKILGVPKDASTEDIKNAYKKLVRQWHPDRYQDKEKKKEAESMMKKINQAFDVLGDPQKRKMYDLGQDPDNPGQNQNFNGGFNIFDLFNMQGGQARTFTFGGGNNFRFEFHMG